MARRDDLAINLQALRACPPRRIRALAVGAAEHNWSQERVEAALVWESGKSVYTSAPVSHTEATLVARERITPCMMDPPFGG